MRSVDVARLQELHSTVALRLSGCHLRISSRGLEVCSSQFIVSVLLPLYITFVCISLLSGGKKYFQIKDCAIGITGSRVELSSRSLWRMNML